MPSLPSFDEELCPAEGGGLGHPAPQEGSPVLAVENIRLGHHRASLFPVRAQFSSRAKFRASKSSVWSQLELSLELVRAQFRAN